MKPGRVPPQGTVKEEIIVLCGSLGILAGWFLPGIWFGIVAGLGFLVGLAIYIMDGRFNG